MKNHPIWSPWLWVSIHLGRGALISIIRVDFKNASYKQPSFLSDKVEKFFIIDTKVRQ
jgi:hypothetical protein